MLNRILRTGRKKFGGDIFGDYGKNRYAPLWDDTSTPISRGFSWVYSMAHNNIGAISHALPGELDVPKGDAKLESLIKSIDPSRVIYNGLVPFLVSVLEFYLKNILIIALKYDSNAQHMITDLRREVSPIALRDEKSPEELIADSISFQDLRNVKKAFRKWLNVDIKKPLTPSETASEESLWRRLDDLIKYRHDIIHRMGVDRSFSRTDFLNQAQLIEESLDLLLKTLADKYQIDIEQIKD
ncbi:HEPN domain-containing protein [Arthrobacter sp. EpRS71]|uniref:HEPN domain-containing protein n=1 Tax=Arthrobacter sp. EpRS71 TaxID=1743141 RepID=UPI0012E33B31|nr:HEPN domain-containing protein [Arthrobacter sp. EpRS71]